MVANGDVAVPALLRRQHHLLERRAAVRPVRVHVGGRPSGRQARRAAVARRRARPRAPPGSRAAPAGSRRTRDGRRRPPRRPPGTSPALDVEDPYSLTERPAADGVLAEGDVVVHRACEVLEQVPVGLGRDDAQVEAEALMGDDGGLRAAQGHLGHPLTLGEEGGQRLDRSPWRSGRGPSSSRSAGGRSRPRRPGPPGRWPRSRQPRVGRQRLAQQRPAGRRRGLRRSRKRLQHLLLGLGAETRQSPQALLLGRRSKIVSDSTPRSDQSFRAVFGPRPGTCMTSTSPDGSLSRSLARAFMSPVSTTSTILASIVEPIRRAASPSRRARAAPPEPPILERAAARR